MEIRKLNAKDLFRMANILNKIGIGELKKVISAEKIASLASQKDIKSDALTTIVGANVIFDVVGIVINNLDKAEKDIFAFLANVTNKETKDIENLDMGEFMDLLVAIFKKDEFKDFFKRASMFAKSE